MKQLYGYGDLARVYGLKTPSVRAWSEHPTFPRPCACYGIQRRPLFDPAEVAAWVSEHRPEHLTAGEVQ
ncbi:hypothetical protein [uncultured Halomonas sp.]|uniref:hypothetical protein n=1 Tax=uncultured Halomonas sp. TaxID=173971 RepID=UPI002633B9CB|nr:hypothetical protein [uncultured Halomonas sp.]